MIIHQISNSRGNYNYNTCLYNDTMWPIHFHGNYELVYTFDGVTEVTVNGVSEALEAGELMLISPFGTHSLVISKNTHTWVGVFSKDYISDFAGRYSFTSFSKFRCDEKIESFLQKTLFRKEIPEHYLLIGCLNLVCGECIKNGVLSSQSNHADFVKKVVIYIADNLSKNISMKEVSAELNYEYHYFSALFHNCFSMNFKRFVNILRFEQACEMLSRSITITEVCDSCGFESIRNFNRIFKEFSGMTPSEYKNNS